MNEAVDLLRCSRLDLIDADLSQQASGKPEAVQTLSLGRQMLQRFTPIRGLMDKEQLW
jgi:hypothetical protein